MKKQQIILVMRSNNNNLIAFSYFECISDNIIGVESYNYTEKILKTIEKRIKKKYSEI